MVERLKLIPAGRNYTVIPEGHHLAVRGLISHVYKRLDPERPAYTVIASGGGGTHGYHHREPRRLSNRERARLQSFPDSLSSWGPARRRSDSLSCGPSGGKSAMLFLRSLRRQSDSAWQKRFATRGSTAVSIRDQSRPRIGGSWTTAYRTREDFMNPAFSSCQSSTPYGLCLCSALRRKALIASTSLR